ncbi:MAG TPA: phosphatidylserine/phosphatidylglycerophosphate/cardiolipin synthase family protein [Bacteroidales bacterium]|nr:phosphatidylserine/phosphatidylglycerophosphate/cardiolipin synthase family protein [Bacteroidales bacterium]
MENNYQLYNDNLVLFNDMLKNIESAKKCILLETFRFGTGSIGEKFRLALILKARQGLKVKVLIDAWGSDYDNNFFNPLIEAGVDLRAYKKLNLARTYFINNHCRNHRKILIIDNEITYIGSSNLTSYSLSWRELNLKIENPELSKLFRYSFNESFRTYNKYTLTKKSYKRNQYHNSWVLVQDVPNPYRQTIKKYYEKMIDKATKDVFIESPYFLPGHILRKKLCEAAKRGVNVVVIMPYHSDVRLVDIVRRKYLGELYEGGVKIRLYIPGNLHSKGLMVDDEVFSIGSSNFDYRSFRYQYEIALIGEEESILKDLRTHFETTLAFSREFDYESWKKRSGIEKFFEWILLPIRYLL